MSWPADPRIADAFAHLPDYFGNHVRVSLIALALGLALSLPLALLCLRRPVLRAAALAVTSIVQTIPGLALLALFYPLLLALASLSEELTGVSFSALGLLPSVLALALYSMLPVLRNTITGLGSIDPAVREAAQGVGMTPRQSLTMVELPLAMPVIMAGIRTAAVWVVGTATLSTPIGQTSLGNYIFAGLQTQNWVSVLFGCVAAALLALAIDQLLALMESGAAKRSRGRIAASALGLLVLIALAFAPGGGNASGAKNYVIGTKPFAEQYVLASLIGERLAASGMTATVREGLGSAVIFDALVAGDIDVYVEYTGTIWANQMKRNDARPREQVLAAVTRWLKDRYNVTVLGGLGFENAYALAMSKQRADALGIRTLSDLGPHSPDLSIAGDYEFFARPEWQALRATYGLMFRRQQSMQSEFMYPAIEGGDVDIIAAYTSDGRVAQYGLTTLTDDRRAIPPYDAIVLISPRRAGDVALAAALRPLIGKIDVATMREANRRVGSENAQTPQAAAAWLWEQMSKQR